MLKPSRRTAKGVPSSNVGRHAFWHVGFELERRWVFDLDQRFAGTGKVPHIGPFAADHAIKWRHNFGIAHHRFRLRHGRLGEPLSRLGIVIL